MAAFDTTAGAGRAIPAGPTGLGTSAARITDLLRPRTAAAPTLPAFTPQTVARPAVAPPSVARPAVAPPSVMPPPVMPPFVTPPFVTPPAPVSQTGGRAVPGLYCPPHLRDDRALAEEVNERLVDWTRQVGIYAGRTEKFRQADFGRLLMLTHPDTDDPDRLLAAGRCLAAEFAVDDYFCEDATTGDHPERLGPQLMLAQSAIDPPRLPGRYQERYERSMREQPVLNALRCSVRDLAAYASGSQVNRLRQEIAGLFLGMDAEAGWRVGGSAPSVSEYLANRQMNSFLPCMTLVDAVGGYELPADVYGRPDVRRATLQAALASVLLNDIYSMHKEGDAQGVEYNLPTVLAAEEGCSLVEATRRSVELHNELVRSFETASAALTLTGDPILTRYLGALWAWLGGNREWHASSPRYNA